VRGWRLSSRGRAGRGRRWAHSVRGQGLECARDVTDLLDAVFAPSVGFALHELKVVDNDEVEAALAGEAARPRTELGDRENGESSNQMFASESSPVDRMMRRSSSSLCCPRRRRFWSTPDSAERRRSRAAPRTSPGRRRQRSPAGRWPRCGRYPGRKPTFPRSGGRRRSRDRALQTAEKDIEVAVAGADRGEVRGVQSPRCPPRGRPGEAGGCGRNRGSSRHAQASDEVFERLKTVSISAGAS